MVHIWGMTTESSATETDLSLESQLSLESRKITWNPTPKGPAEFLVYRKVVASILLSDFEGGLHPAQITQALA